MMTLCVLSSLKVITFRVRHSRGEMYRLLVTAV